MRRDWRKMMFLTKKQTGQWWRGTHLRRAGSRRRLSGLGARGGSEDAAEGGEEFARAGATHAQREAHSLAYGCQL